MPFVLKMTAIYIAANAAIMLVLALHVVRMRWRTRTRLGNGEKPEMLQAIRAHANNTEYVPIALILLFTVHALGGNVLLVHAIGLPLTLGRILHAAAILSPTLMTGNGVPPGRTAGMILTVLAMLVGIVACLWLVAAAPV